MKRPAQHPLKNLGKYAHPVKSTRPKPSRPSAAAVKSVATKIRKASRYG